MHGVTRVERITRVAHWTCLQGSIPSGFVQYSLTNTKAGRSPCYLSLAREQWWGSTSKAGNICSFIRRSPPSVEEIALHFTAVSMITQRVGRPSSIWKIKEKLTQSYIIAKLTETSGFQQRALSRGAISFSSFVVFHPFSKAKRREEHPRFLMTHTTCVFSSSYTGALFSPRALLESRAMSEDSLKNWCQGTCLWCDGTETTNGHERQDHLTSEGGFFVFRPRTLGLSRLGNLGCSFSQHLDSIVRT